MYDDLQILEVKKISELESLGKAIGKNVLSEVFKVYMETTPAIINSIRCDFNQYNNISICKSAHKLKSAAKNLGCLKLAQASADLEDSVSKNMTSEQINQLITFIIPKIEDHRWREFVLSNKEFAFKHLVTQLMYVRIKIFLKNDNSEASVAAAVALAHNFFTKNQRAIVDDLQIIFNEFEK